MDTPDNRHETLRLLVELATASGTDSCWDQNRAETLLRNQSDAGELRGLGVSEDLILYLWPQPQP